MKLKYDIPKEWENVKLKNLVTQDIKNGYSPNCPEETNGRWILSLGNLSENGFDPSQAKPAPKEDDRVNDFLLEPGDFLISRSNTLDKVGRTILFRGEIENCSYPDLLMRFRVDEARVVSAFLECYLRSSIVRKHIQSCASGTSSSMVKINKTAVENIPVVLPTYPEQKAIAALLSTWDDAIEKIERLVKAKERRFKWLLRELISEPRNTQKGTEWKKVKLGDYVVERNEKSTKNNQYPVFTSSRRGLFYQTDYFSKQVTSSNNEGYKILHKGDFTYRAMSDDGKFVFNRYEISEYGIISPAYGVFYPNRIDSDYLLFYLNSPTFHRELLKLSQGGTRIALKFSSMKNLWVRIPKAEIQIQISETLSLIKQEIDLLKIMAEKYKIQKRGLMQKMLTGEWRLKPEVVKKYTEV